MITDSYKLTTLSLRHVITSRAIKNDPRTLFLYGPPKNRSTITENPHERVRPAKDSPDHKLLESIKPLYPESPWLAERTRIPSASGFSCCPLAPNSLSITESISNFSITRSSSFFLSPWVGLFNLKTVRRPPIDDRTMSWPSDGSNLRAGSV